MTAKADFTQTEMPPNALEMGEYYMDPVDEWIAEQSEEWSRKYQGKHLAIVDCEVVAVEDTMEAAFKVFDEKYTDKPPFVWYMPKAEEIENILL